MTPWEARNDRILITRVTRGITFLAVKPQARRAPDCKATCVEFSRVKKCQESRRLYIVSVVSNVLEKTIHMYTNKALVGQQKSTFDFRSFLNSKGLKERRKRDLGFQEDLWIIKASCLRKTKHCNPVGVLFLQGAIKFRVCRPRRTAEVPKACQANFSGVTQ